MAEIVLDASAVLVWLFDEPGQERVEAALAHDECLMSAVNLSEVVAKLTDDGMDESEVAATIQDLRVQIRELDEVRAIAAGMLRPGTRSAGLSLGDRACIALAQELQLPVMTADRPWLTVDLGIEVRLARPDSP